MKRLLYIGLMVMVLSVVTACANDSKNNVENPIVDNVNESTENDATNNQEDDTATKTDKETPGSQDDQTAMQEKMDKLDFQEFDLDVEYPEDIEYQAEIEKKSTGLIEAELEDEANNIKFKGLQAFEEIYPLVEKLDITKDSSEEDIINQITSAFDLAEDYTEFEIKIGFNDGTKIKHEVKK